MFHCVKLTCYGMPGYMKQILRSLLPALFWLALAASPVRAQTGSGVSIETPSAGEALQGIVAITGSTAVEGFGYAELAFAYAGDSTGTWFLIATLTSPVEADTLASWDTTAITDGNYMLRLRVYLADDSTRDAVVTRLRVRNYTAIETPTPAPTAKQPTSIPSITPTSTPFPTPTPLPTNEAILTRSDVSVSVGLGGIVAVLLLALLSLYLWLRRKL
jgi:hypothetical protein